MVVCFVCDILYDVVWVVLSWSHVGCVLCVCLMCLCDLCNVWCDVVWVVVFVYAILFE